MNQKAHAFNSLREWVKMSQLLTTGAVLRLWHCKSLALMALHAWAGNDMHAWYVQCFR